MVAKKRFVAENKPRSIHSFIPEPPLARSSKDPPSTQMATPNKYRKSEWKSADLNQRAEQLQHEIERLETTLGPSVALYSLSATEHNKADPRLHVGT